MTNANDEHQEEEYDRQIIENIRREKENDPQHEPTERNSQQSKTFSLLIDCLTENSILAPKILIVKLLNHALPSSR